MYWVDFSAKDSELRVLMQEWRDETLKQFVASADLAVRQRILPSPSMDKASYSSNVAALVDRAIESARSDPDEYIRHRIEIQLGGGGPFKPLPSP